MAGAAAGQLKMQKKRIDMSATSAFLPVVVCGRGISNAPRARCRPCPRPLRGDAEVQVDVPSHTHACRSPFLRYKKWRQKKSPTNSSDAWHGQPKADRQPASVQKLRYSIMMRDILEALHSIRHWNHWRVGACHAGSGLPARTRAMWRAGAVARPRGPTTRLGRRREVWL